MNRGQKAFVAGMVGGLVAPLSSLIGEPARRINPESIYRTPSGVAASWRIVGKAFEAGISRHGSSGKAGAASS